MGNKDHLPGWSPLDGTQSGDYSKHQEAQRKTEENDKERTDRLKRWEKEDPSYDGMPPEGQG